MTWVFAIVIVLAMGGVAVVASGRGGSLAPAYDDRPDSRIAAGRDLVGEDLREVRFSLGLRGYRMAEVDALLDRLADQLDRPPATQPPPAEPESFPPPEDQEH